MLENQYLHQITTVEYFCLCRYIRFIYNRVILENPTVRAAAVSAMAQFGATCPDLLENIQVLLARCQMDSDDEVRDRATYYSSILKQQDKTLYNNYIIDTLPVRIIFQKIFHVIINYSCLNAVMLIFCLLYIGVYSFFGTLFKGLHL